MTLTEKDIENAMYRVSEALFEKIITHGEKNWVSQLQCEQQRNTLIKKGVAFAFGIVLIIAVSNPEAAIKLFERIFN